MAVRIRWFYCQAAGGFTSVSCIGPIDVDIDRCIYRYGKNSEISPGASVFQRPFVRGLYSGWGGGHIYRERFAFQNQLGLYLKENLRFKID